MISLRRVVSGLSIFFVAVSCADHSANLPSNAPVVSASSRVPVAVAQTAEADSFGSRFATSDFTLGGDALRDPFQASWSTLRDHSDPPPTPPIGILLADVSLSELRLEAIVRVDAAYRAMVVAPDGKGTTIVRGDYVGRGDAIASAASPLFWRVDRITEDEVVLARRDALHPEAPPSYRVIALHGES